MRRITTAVAIAGLLSLVAEGDAFAQTANPCGAKNPCAAKASKGAATESATVQTGAARGPATKGVGDVQRGFAAPSGARSEGPPPIDPIQAP